jgi:hypothetical protein
MTDSANEITRREAISVISERLSPRKKFLGGEQQNTHRVPALTFEGQIFARRKRSSVFEGVPDAGIRDSQRNRL